MSVKVRTIFAIKLKKKKNEWNCIPMGSNKPFTGTMGFEIMVRCKPERR